MKSKLTEWLVKPYLNESPDLDIKVGDDILMGRFKNKRVKVKSITYNEKGDLLINGRPALKFRKVKNDKKLLPSKTTNKTSAEPDSDRKGVDDEYPHFKLKEEPKFQSVHTKSTFDSTFGGWYTKWVPLSTKKIQSIIGNERVSVFHVGNAEYERDVTQVQRIVGKKGTLSTFTSVDKGEKLAKGQGIQSGGGIIYQIEGTLLVASTRDMQSHPDKTGRRWIDPYSLDRYEESDVIKLDILLNGDKVDALAYMAHRTVANLKGKQFTEALKEVIPRQQFDVAIQAAIGAKIISRQTVKAYRKDVTAKLYGGDVTRKMKLQKKQKEGKKRMKNIGRVEVPQDAFLSVLKVGD